MNNRILFMIINNNVQYLQNSTMDHREWYASLGYPPETFDNIVRGYVIDKKIVFFKGINFNYDQEVIMAAKTFSPSIRLFLQDSSLEVYCGIVVNSYGEKWEPVLKINEDELQSNIPLDTQEKNNKNEVAEMGPVLELKNDYNNQNFVRRATLVTTIVLIITIVMKVYLFFKGEILQVNNISDIILTFLQIFLLSFTIYGYKKGVSYTKYLGLGASICIILTFHFIDVVMGVLYFLFNVDQEYFVKIRNFFGKYLKLNKQKSS